MARTARWLKRCKDEMKRLVGHSPDFIEGFFMVENINTDRKAYSRSGFGAYAG